MTSWIPSPATARNLFYGVVIGFTLSMTATSLAQTYQRRKRDKQDSLLGALHPIELRSDDVLDGIAGLIGVFASI